MGALGVTAKPAGHDELSRVFGALAEQVRRDERRLLIVGGTAADRKKIKTAVAGKHRQVEIAPTVATARTEMGSFDGVVVAADKTAQDMLEPQALQVGRDGTPMIVRAGPHSDRKRAAAEHACAGETMRRTKE